mmetsp:Transcript_24388/g.44170  ORF Transcript_24388/g.44170 Transcript_24388/m.44170 type:complete len:180 (-) Transcript_24388:298-837(-)|eukprot:CAMPEP_0197664062 /NCGR_PEP_ID=MMETSP1338-20131121/58409_1 /TAXON_ID=43686 ORGANISM="Pelagodinium beii, Strain RCC1491" /NCGR_SAMPLE_ID=MMETSP1338 /ASSEMBLY_ACC=CAM_ASM_000754 /LENGTH=179 /DNA_ID=CAMNT_0043242625 /DNA_START=71 /DNA_END=610 /DNA_ORIENTATION=-
MVFAGSLDAFSGPPTPFALRMRPWLVFDFFILGVVAAARLVAMDVTGCFFLAGAVFMGYLAIRKGMNIAWLLCLAMVLFLNSLLDTFLILAVAMRTHWAIFSLRQPWYSLMVQGLLVLGPVAELAGAWMCWDVYKDHLSNMSATDAFLLDAEHGPAQSYQATEPARQFSAFSGTGHRLS